jgi:hypothetical protein
MDLPAWTVDELQTRYSLEPELRDMFVEGQFDKDVISAALKSAEPENNIVIYIIDVIRVESELLRKYALTLGNKQRLLALSRELALVKGNLQCVCVVDRDYDEWMKTEETNSIIRYIRYCGIENYFLDGYYINEILVVASRSKIDDFNEFYNSAVSALKELYCIRLTDMSLKLNSKFIDFDRCISIRGGLVVFNSEEYIKRHLLKNSIFKHADKFSKKLAHWKSSMEAVDSPRRCIRGHDFIDLLVFCIRAFKGIRSLADQTLIERMLVLLASKNIEILEEILPP